jgi:hypothetical protein
MSIVDHLFDITWIDGRGRDSRLPSGFPSLEGTALAWRIGRFFRKGR